MCYGRNKGFNHDHRTCPIDKADTEAYKKVHGSKKRAPPGIQEIKRSTVPRSDDKNKENKEKDKDKKSKKRGEKKSVNEVDAEESTPSTTTDAP